MLEKLAKALRLTEVEYESLFLLADLSYWSGPTVDTWAQKLLDNIKACPAYICTPRLDIVAYNRLANAIFDFRGDGSASAANQLWRIYTDPQRRRRFKEVAAEKSNLLRTAQAYCATQRGQDDLAGMLFELRQANRSFADDWSSLLASEALNSELVLNDGDNRYSVTRIHLSIMGHSDSEVIVLLPADGAAERSLRVIESRSRSAEAKKIASAK